MRKIFMKKYLGANLFDLQEGTKIRVSINGSMPGNPGGGPAWLLPESL